MQDQIIEEWRPVVGFERTHSISSIGRLRRESSSRYLILAPRILKSYVSPNGYPYIWLHDGPEHIKHLPIHVVVAEAFIGERPSGKVVNHKDGNKLNNCPENLEWVSPSSNNIHALKAGLRANPRGRRGEEHSMVKVSAADVIAIRASKDLLRVLAARYGLGTSQVSRIRNGLSWEHL